MGGDLMYLEENKKVLFVVGMEQNVNIEYVKEKYQLLPEEIHMIESDELDRIEPFGDLMRDILLYVYQKDIEEIVIVDQSGKRNHSESILSMIDNRLDMQNSNSILDYLFSHGNPEFQEGTIREWIEGSHRIIEDRQDNVEKIRRHPLMPDSIIVTNLRLDQEWETA